MKEPPFFINGGSCILEASIGVKSRSEMPIQDHLISSTSGGWHVKL